MNKLISLVFVMSLVACGNNGVLVVNAPAPSCKVKTTDAGTAISCPDGTTAFVPNGLPGLNGGNGVDGRNGVDATPVTMVQLCEGTPSYPSTFIEVAFCINNKLYAVYSANGGFMTYLPEGAYSSNGIGSRCNLTVKPNCVITN